MFAGAEYSLFEPVPHFIRSNRPFRRFTVPWCLSIPKEAASQSTVQGPKEEISSSMKIKKVKMTMNINIRKTNV